MMPRPGPSLARLDLAAVQLDDVADDREAEAEPAVRTRDGRVALAEAIEDERQQVRRDPFAVVGRRSIRPRCADPRSATRSTGRRAA